VVGSKKQVVVENEEFYEKINDEQKNNEN